MKCKECGQEIPFPELEVGMMVQHKDEEIGIGVIAKNEDAVLMIYYQNGMWGNLCEWEEKIEKVVWGQCFNMFDRANIVWERDHECKKEEPFPELKEGMMVQWDDNEWGIVSKDKDGILRIFWKTGGRRWSVDRSSLIKKIAWGDFCDINIIIWERK